MYKNLEAGFRSFVFCSYQAPKYALSAVFLNCSVAVTHVRPIASSVSPGLKNKFRCTVKKKT
jgi:hypothetical protein